MNPLQDILTDLDRCRAAKDETPADAHTDALREIETRLANMVTVDEEEVLLLMACLGDQKLSAETREKIAANLAWIAPYASVRFKRSAAFLQAQENGVWQFLNFRTEANNSLIRAIGMVSVAQAALEKISPSIVRDGLNEVLGTALNDLLAASTVFDLAHAEIERPNALARETLAQNKIEEDLLAEAFASTVQ